VKAIQVRTTGGPEVLVLREFPDPVPQAGEVLIRVHTPTVSNQFLRHAKVSNRSQQGDGL
jgi:D-arabinose 1-dehydrogenase-like Zn-dependent alcohol dehydrogenase